MIEQLQKFETNNLDDWYELSDSNQTDFLRKLAEYFELNKSELYIYCNKLKPNEFSSLSIIYEAISIYSFKLNDFIFEEVKRIIELSKKNDIKPIEVEILEDFEMEDIYEKDYSTYKDIIDFLINSLSKNQSDKLNIAILDILDYYLIESDDNKDSKLWENQISKFLEKSSENVRKYKSNNTKTKILSKILKTDGLKWQILFYVGLVSQLFAILYFRKTIIETNISVGLYFLFGFVGLLLFHKKMQSYVSNWFSKIIYSIVTFGGISVMLFLFLNYQFASKELEINKYEIIEKSYLGGGYGKSPRVFVKIDNVRKEFLFPNSRIDKINKSQYLTIEKAKGFFGYEIIRSKKLD